jgi:phospholipase/carboxylesterase
MEKSDHEPAKDTMFNSHHVAGAARRVAILFAALAPMACVTEPDPVVAPPSDEVARLTARPAEPTEPRPNGRYRLHLGVGRDGWFYIPPGLEEGEAAPMVVMLHGATGNARNFDGAIKYADSLGMVLMAPDARAPTWDILVGGFGPDVAFIDDALNVVFKHATVDRNRVALSGFSDGASYALSLGLANGDLFTHLIAWSPGFLAPVTPHGSPLIFVSHGIRDGILPIDVTSRRLVPDLQGAGYDVIYEEFDGLHEIPPELARGAFEWFVSGDAPASPS